MFQTPFQYPTNDEDLRRFAAIHREGIIGVANGTNARETLIADVARYLDENGINDVVLGVSGGVDSALALAVLVEVQKRQHLNIHAEVITFDCFAGVFDEDYIGILRVKYGTVKWNKYDLSDALMAMGSAMNPVRGILGQPGFDEGPEANIAYALRYQAIFARALDADIKRVYRVYSTQADDYALGTGNRPMTLDISGDTFYIVTKSGKITEMTNSEWGQLRICDTM
jgi:NH3-dependent NAD+ synthetase